MFCPVQYGYNIYLNKMAIYNYMTLLESDEIKINILKMLNKSNHELSLNGLRKRIGAVNYNSVKRNCEFLEKFQLINVEQKLVEGRNYNFISITEKGRKSLGCLKDGATKLK